MSVTLKREFGEEALGGKNVNMDRVWKNSKQLYAGYVDDPRNCDVIKQSTSYNTLYYSIFRRMHGWRQLWSTFTIKMVS